MPRHPDSAGRSLTSYQPKCRLWALVVLGDLTGGKGTGPLEWYLYRNPGVVPCLAWLNY